MSVAMPPNHGARLAEEERAELERVVEAMARWPRVSQLLRYMGEKLFSGEVDELNEYNIATEVLGRSKTVFNAADDAIARVETHRLRKRLAEFYEDIGRDHAIQVTLPSGSYVPVFIHKRGTPSVEDVSHASASDLHPENRQPIPLTTRNWKYLALAAVACVIAVGLYLYYRATPSAKSETTQATATAALSPQLPTSPAPIRILAGYSGPPRTDTGGRIWSADQYFSAGGSWRRGPEFLARTSDPFIFEYSRTGDFSYSIPLKPGSYELHLFFSTPVRSDQGLATFNADVNGERLLDAFDVDADAMGPNIADERVFRDVSPGQDGVLRIAFSGANGPPTVNAIEVVPGLRHAQLPVRLIMQTSTFTDHKGQVWHPDNYFMEGRLSGPTRPVVNSPDPDLFAGERYGHFSYAIPVDTRDRYTLILHFAEFYFGTGAPQSGGTGSRIFKVICNGETLLDNFDIFKEAGSLHEVSKTFHHLKPSAQGKLNLTFEPITNNATISGIEVLDESQ